MLRQFQYPDDYLEVFQGPEFPVNVDPYDLGDKYDTNGLEAFEGGLDGLPKDHKSLIDRMASWAGIVPPIVPHTRSATAMLREPIKINGETVYGYVLRGVGYHGTDEFTGDSRVLPARAEAYFGNRRGFYISDNWSSEVFPPFELGDPGFFGGVDKVETMVQLRAMATLRGIGLKTNIPLAFTETDIRWDDTRGAVSIEGLTNPIDQRSVDFLLKMSDEEFRSKFAEYCEEIAFGIRKMVFEAGYLNWFPHLGNTSFDEKGNYYYYDLDSLVSTDDVAPQNFSYGICIMAARFLTSMLYILDQKGLKTDAGYYARLFLDSFFGSNSDNGDIIEILATTEFFKQSRIDVRLVGELYKYYLSSDFCDNFGEGMDLERLMIIDPRVEEIINTVINGTLSQKDIDNVRTERDFFEIMDRLRGSSAMELYQAMLREGSSGRSVREKLNQRLREVFEKEFG